MGWILKTMWFLYRIKGANMTKGQGIWVWSRGNPPPLSLQKALVWFPSPKLNRQANRTIKNIDFYIRNSTYGLKCLLSMSRLMFETVSIENFEGSRVFCVCAVFVRRAHHSSWILFMIAISVFSHWQMALTVTSKAAQRWLISRWSLEYI